MRAWLVEMSATWLSLGETLLPFTNSIFSEIKENEKQIYLWDPFPSKEVPTLGALWWLVPGDISERAARIGAVPVSPASVGGCLKQELSRISLQS